MRARNISGLASLAALSLLAACGGGGDSGGGAAVIVPSGAPAFTSAASASVAENTTAPAYTASATVPQGQTVSYSLAGGADAARVQMTAAGVVTFTAPPNFELPADANRDNNYDIIIRATAGSLTTDLAVRLTVTNVAGRLSTVRVGSGFTQPLFLTAVPDQSGRVYVVQKGGQVRILNPATGAIAGSPFLDVSSQIATTSEQGLLGFTPAPDFATSGFVYVYLTVPDGNTNEIRRYRTATGNRDLIDPATADVVLRVPHPTYDNHNGGWLGFGPDGNLYVATGDGGGGGDPLANAQNRNTLNGKILRIDVRSDAFPTDPNRDYAIPTTNPFATSGGAPEVWLFGLRNPFRNSFDRDTGNLFIGDVGQGDREEISLARQTDNGRNYGWPILEGTFQYSQGATAGLTPPITEYTHGTGQFQGRSVTGGYVYRGPIASFRGNYVFADFVNRRVWSLPVSAVSQGTTLTTSAWTDQTTPFAPAVGAIGMVTSFGEDDVGNVYIVDFDGEIFLITEIE